MKLPQITLTGAQTWLVHALEALFQGAVVIGAIAGYQAVSSGNYNVQSLLGIVLPAFVAVLSKGASTSILSNANLLPALMDTVKELQAALPQGQAPAQHITNVYTAPTPPVAHAPQTPVQGQETALPVPVADTPLGAIGGDLARGDVPSTPPVQPAWSQGMPTAAVTFTGKGG